MTEVRAKKALGQHFLTDQKIARDIVDALHPLSRRTRASADARPGRDFCEGKSWKGEKAAGGSGEPCSPVLEVGPGMGVLTQYLLQREDIDLKLVEIDSESVEYLLTHFPGMEGRLMEADFMTLPLERIFPGTFSVIGNFPYNISSQIFFKVLDYKDRIPVCSGMIQKEVAERLASKPGKKAYGILSVLLQAYYDIEYLFTVDEYVFNPPPKVKSAVIRMTRNKRRRLDCDEALFKTVVKTAFNQRRKQMRNSLQQLVGKGNPILEENIFTMRPEQLSVEQFIELTTLIESNHV